MLDLYNHGHLKLDELVTKQYKLDEVAQGYEDMHAGKNIRGVAHLRLITGPTISQETLPSAL